MGLKVVPRQHSRAFSLSWAKVVCPFLGRVSKAHEKLGRSVLRRHWGKIEITVSLTGFPAPNLQLRSHVLCTTCSVVECVLRGACSRIVYKRFVRGRACVPFLSCVRLRARSPLAPV